MSQFWQKTQRRLQRLKKIVPEPFQPQAVLLAEVGEGARDPGVPAGVADPRLVGHAVDMAVAGAAAAVLQLAQPGGDPLGQRPRAVPLQVRRLEGLEQEPGIESA